MTQTASSTWPGGSKPGQGNGRMALRHAAGQPLHSLPRGGIVAGSSDPCRPGLTFMDSAGVMCLFECHQSCASLGVSLEIAPSREVARVLDLVRFREATETRVSPPTPSTSATDESETGMVADKTGGD
jgi:hypothetical protein